MSLDADLLGLDSFSDLAVLKISTPEERLSPLKIGESATVKVGQRAISIGNPFGLKASMTTGIVSGIGRTLPSAQLMDAGVRLLVLTIPSIIQIDAAVHPGNSGGPLLDSKGLVIGITTAMQSDSGQFQGIGFAVPADTMRRVIPDLIAEGRVEYAWMGISVMPENGGYGVAGLSEALDLPVERGVLLRGVTRRLAGGIVAGLRGGDSTVDVRGKPVCAGGDLIVAINDFYIEDLDALITYLVQNARPAMKWNWSSFATARRSNSSLDSWRARPATRDRPTIGLHHGAIGRTTVKKPALQFRPRPDATARNRRYPSGFSGWLRPKEIAKNTFVPHPYPPDGAEEFVQQAREEWRKDEAYVFAIIEKASASICRLHGHSPRARASSRRSRLLDRLALLGARLGDRGVCG